MGDLSDASSSFEGSMSTTTTAQVIKELQDESTDSTKEESVKEHKKFLEKLGSRWFTVEPLVIIYMAAYMSLMPLLQQYTRQRLSEDYNITTDGLDSNVTTWREHCLNHADDDNETQNELEFHTKLSAWTAAMMALPIFPTLLTIFIVGAFSDSRGRRFSLVPQIGAGIFTGVVLILVVHFKLHLAVLVLSNVIVGFTGSMPAVLMASFAYIADINAPEKRFMRIVAIEIGMGLGNFLANLLFGWLIEVSGFMLPSAIFTATMALALAYCIFFVPETILVEKGAKLCDMSSLKSLPELWVRPQKGSNGRRSIIWLCCAIMFLNTMFSEGPQYIITLIVIDPPLCWGPTLIGVFNGIQYVLKAFGGLAFMKLMFGRLHPGSLLMTGLLSSIALFTCLGLAKSTWVAFIGAVLGCGSMLVGPISRSIASAKCPDTLQGSLFSGLGWFQMLATLISSPIVNYMFDALPHGGDVFLWAIPCFSMPITLVIVLYFIDKKYDRKLRHRSSTINGVTVTDTDDIVSCAKL